MEETVEVDGINVYYDVAGNGENLLILHGLGIGRRALEGMAAGASKYFTVYTPDLPGFGLSDMPDVAYSVPFYAGFVDRLMGELGLETCAVAGISLGGAIAATLAASRPEKVSKLVLMAPAGMTPPRGEFVKPSRLMDASYWLLSHNKDMFRRSLENMFCDKSKATPQLVDDVWADMRVPEHRRALLKNSQYLAKVDMAFPGMLSSIVAPTLIAWGREDQIIPVTDAERFAGLIPNADVLTFGRCGHVIPLEKGDMLTDAVVSFLAEEDQYYEINDK